MDLLGGYSSDDGNSSNDDDNDVVSSHPKILQSTTTVLPTSVKQDNVVTPKESQKAPISRRAKKLVSLHAVLPPHIWDSLTQGENDDDDDDDDDNPPYKKVKPNVAASNRRDEGIQNFLSALKGAKRTESAKPEKLGAAFTTVVTTTVKKQHAVQDIHNDHPVVSTSSNTTSSVKAAAAPKVSLSKTTSSVTALAPRISLPKAGQPQYQPQQPQPAPHNDPQWMDDYQEEDDPVQGSSRSQKRALQKALRAGQFAEANNNMIELQQVNPTAHVPQPETYAVPAHGVKMVATQMYNPKLGSDQISGKISGKQRSKHQINQLMASAAAYELEQARSGAPSIKAHRADAKRKYGW